MRKPLQLVVLTPEYLGYGGGIMTYYRTMLPALVRAGCSVKVIQGSAYFASTAANPQLIDGVFVETLEQSRLQRWESRMFQLSALPALSRSIAASWAMWEQVTTAQEIDVIEATDFGLPFVAPLLSASIPLIMQMHGSQGQIAIHDPQESRILDGILELAVETNVAAQASEVQSSSQSNVGYWLSQMGRKVCLRRPAWTSVDKTETASSPSDRLSVFGRVQRWKGPQVLCEALRKMGQQAPQVDWYGRDTPFESTGTMTSDWLAEKFPDVWGIHVVWHPQVPPAQVAEIQSRSLLNVVPSTWDVFNFTVVEAMASGRPVICSSGAGASDLIENGVTGFVYQSNSPVELACAIDRALKLTPARQVELGQAAKRFVTHTLDPDRIAAERLDAYRIATGVTVKRDLAQIPDWIKQLCIPSGSTVSDNFSFLDQLPLRGIARYAGERALRKLIGK